MLDPWFLDILFLASSYVLTTDVNQMIVVDI
jgi:hypothetical protein